MGSAQPLLHFRNLLHRDPGRRSLTEFSTTATDSICPYVHDGTRLLSISRGDGSFWIATQWLFHLDWIRKYTTRFLRV